MSIENVTSYFKVIDVYILFNIIFVFFSLIQTFIVNLWLKNANTLYYKSEKNENKAVVWLERSFKIGYLLIYISCALIYTLLVM